MPRPPRKPIPLLLLLALCGCVTPLGAPRLEARRVQEAHDPSLFDAPREEVVQALEAVLREEGFEVVEDQRPGLGPWRVVARSAAEERFISLVGLRGRVQEIEAGITSTTGGRTRVSLDGRLWVYVGDPPSPGSADSAEARASAWRDRPRLDDLLNRLARRLHGK